MIDLPKCTFALLVLALSTTAAACGDDGGGGPFDVGPDATSDVAPDGTGDSGPVDDGVPPIVPTVPGDTEPEATSPTPLVIGALLDVSLSDGTRLVLDLPEGSGAGTQLSEVVLERDLAQ